MVAVELPRFGGLDLSRDPQEVGGGGAIDGLNFSLQADGRLKTRAGYTAFATGLAITPWVLHEYSSSNRVAIGAGALTNGAYVLNSAGTAVASSAGVKAGGFANINSQIWAGGNDGMFVWSPGDVVFSAGTYTNPVTCVGVTPWDDRLVLGHGSTVRFSDVGTPDSITQFVSLTEDGSTISEMVAWRDLLFVFTSTAFYVFYSTDVLGNGDPIFNYRPVQGVGVAFSSAGTMVAAGKNAVYFLAPDGVYATTGGIAERISRPLDAWFRGDTLPHSTLPAYNPPMGVNGAIGVVGDYLYARVPTASSAITWVCHLPTGQWTAYNWAMVSCIPYKNVTTSVEIPMIGIGTGLFKHLPSATTDNAAIIDMSYRTGFMTFGEPSGESVVREWILDGTGSVGVKTAENDSSTLSTGSTITLGSSPATSDNRHRVASRGRNHSVRLSSAGPCSVSRVVANVRSSRSPAQAAT